MTDKPITPEEAANYIGELIVHGWDKSAICPEKRAYDIINQQRRRR